MKHKKLKFIWRFEFEVVPIIENKEIAEKIKNKFDKLLKEMISENLINMHDGASMTCVDVTPIEWML